MKAYFAVVRRELGDIVTSPIGGRLVLIHLALVFVATLLGWPSAYELGQARWAPTLAWNVYAEVLVLSYLALAIPADILPIEGSIRPGDWISYGNVHPVAVHLGKTTATLICLLYLVLTALPAVLMAFSLSPIAFERLAALALFAILLLSTLTQIGGWIGAMIDSTAVRVVAVDLAFAAVMLGSIVLQSASAAVNIPLFAQPLEVTARIIEVSAQEVFLEALANNIKGITLPLPPQQSVTEGVPWVPLIAVYGLTFVVAGALSIVSLRQWLTRKAR